MSFSLLFSDFNLWTETLRLWASSFTHFIHDMASRMKRLFHRKRDDDASSTDQRDAYPSGSDPALRTSLYDTTFAGGQPQTGDYPLRGNDDPVALTHQASQVVRPRSQEFGQSEPLVTKVSHTGSSRGAEERSERVHHRRRDFVNPELQNSKQPKSPPAGPTPESNQKRWSHTHTFHKTSPT